MDTEIEEEASLTLPIFYSNPYCNSGNDVKVKDNKTVILTDSIYKKIEIGKISKVTFASDVLYIKELKTKYTDTIEFSSNCVAMYVCKKVDLKKDNIFNSNGKKVVMYVEEDLDVDKGSNFTGSVYSEKKIDSKGYKNARTIMKGMFIAEHIHSKYTDWNWDTNCGSCASFNT